MAAKQEYESKLNTAVWAVSIALVVSIGIDCSDASSESDAQQFRAEDVSDDERPMNDAGDTADATTCSYATCAGCCLEGRCYPGVTAESCGIDGNACIDCGIERECFGGVCLALGCGNGILEEGEACDGDAMSETTCAAVGFSTGTLSCDAFCRYDVSGCEGNPCDWDEQNERRCRFCSGNVNVHCAWCDASQDTDEQYDCSDRNDWCYDTSDGVEESYGSLCMPTDHEVPCDTTTFAGHCSDENEAVGCTGGMTMSFDCDDQGLSCVVNDLGVAECRDPRTTTCDAETFATRCQENDMVWCRYGYTAFESCYDDESCIEDSTSLRCQSTTLGACTAPDYACDANRAYQCVDSGVWWRIHDCNQWDPAFSCVEFDGGAYCSL